MKKTTPVFITHDLDEAVRVGHPIAIMRDGQVIQIGTPEDIVVNPIDKYVEEFVRENIGVESGKGSFNNETYQCLQILYC